MGGPNLLRSQVVLMDQQGELILPIVHGERKERGMPALPLQDEDVRAVAEFIHSVLSTSRGQGAPPESDAPPPNRDCRRRGCGPGILRGQVQLVPLARPGDLKGIATANPEGKDTAEPLGFGDGRGGRGGGGRRGRGAPGRLTRKHRPRR